MKKVFTRMLVVLLALSTICTDALAVSITNPVPAGTTTEPDPATVNSALNEFKNLSGKEKKERLKEVKKAVKEFKAQKKANKEPVASTVVQVIFAILLPPLGVYLHEGEINNKFWIDLILTLLFYLPGMIYALIVVLGT
jgi:uncharacterized membrane protein YqaE (UPF0057 family)